MRSGEMTGTAAVEGDGRRLRRDRNRDAVVDALLALYEDGILDPSSRQIAHRAGLSPRSLFRYFDDVDDLCRAAFARQIERITTLVGSDVDATAPLPARVARFVDERITIADASSLAGVVARAKAPFQPAIAAELAEGRRRLRVRTAAYFAPELDPDSALVAVIDVLGSFESIQLLRGDPRRTRDDVARMLAVAITAVLSSEVSM